MATIENLSNLVNTQSKTTLIRNYFSYKFIIYFFNHTEETNIERLFNWKSTVTDSVMEALKNNFTKLYEYIKGHPLNDNIIKNIDTIIGLIEEHYKNKIKIKNYNKKFIKLLTELFRPTRSEKFDALKDMSIVSILEKNLKDFNGKSFEYKFNNFFIKGLTRTFLMTKYFNRTVYEQQEGDLEKQSISELNELNQIANAPDGAKQVEIKLNEMIEKGITTPFTAPEVWVKSEELYREETSQVRGLIDNIIKTMYSNKRIKVEDPPFTRQVPSTPLGQGTKGSASSINATKPRVRRRRRGGKRNTKKVKRRKKITKKQRLKKRNTKKIKRRKRKTRIKNR